MYSEKSENGQKTTLQIKQDDKFFCRLLSKETSISNPSFRVTPVAVPFLWESHPGTPKHPFSDLSLPPLTPPPSYYYNANNASNKPINNKKSSRSYLSRFSFPRFNLRKTLLLPSSPSSSLSSSSSSSSSSDSSRTVGSNGRRRRFLSCDSAADLWGNSNCEEHDEAVVVADSRNPTSCFGFRRSASSNGGFGGCYGRQA
ncbi:uncharacterized protein LOC114763183 [Neltuma alba]|uniref:uncharacterized protein LOC114763183 n=1 Tax=Neltuma alba TaxID=207710 RepID=UPI0010A3C90E|nr:uncharacterized protein LOC114763183 [Prosopis alba]